MKKHPKKSECECHEETFEEDCDCDTENNEPNHDEGCGCGTENLETSENDDCCCGSIDFPDLSRVDNPDKPKFTANEEFIKEFEDYAHSLGISNVGYSLLTPKLLIKDKFIQYPFTIVLNIEMHKDIIDTPPGIDAKDLNDTAYVKLAIITTKLSDYLRKNGFGTEIAHPYGGLVNFSALGQEAGTGYIGESGLLISPELGPRQKISAIFTSISNLPLNEENEHAWIPEYCEICGKCVKACPEKALVEVDSCCGSEVELVKKNCIGCSLGCTYCIEACPFEEKGYEHVKNKFDKINAKLKEKQAKYFDVKLWNNWVNENTELFKDLLNDFTMAIAVAENENILLINKVDNELKVGLKPFDELEKCKADLLFVMDEKTIEELLKDFTTVKLSKLLSSKEIDVYGLNDQLELKNNGYIAFLNKLGISLGDGSCCS
ncbi:MAG: 4Fe-4S binding protein [Methanobacterium sp. ERen5]|nr:MAG: 4Fe-4S binding protein [Methanobacterium sp. ERen5]